MKLSHCAVVLIVLATWVISPDTNAEPLKSLRLGSVAADSANVMHRRLTPLTQYLSQSLGMPVSLKLAPDITSAVDDVIRGNVDISYLSPVAYIHAHEKGGARLVVKAVNGKEATFRLMIVVRQESPIKNIADLAGKRFAFGEKAALLQKAVLVNAGMPLEKLGAYEFIGPYDNIARSVMIGDFHAGVLKDAIARKYEGKGLYTLYTSPELPPYNITAAKHVDDATLKRLKNAFQDLKMDNPSQQFAIRALDASYTGFMETTDGEFDITRQLIAPFEKKE